MVNQKTVLKGIIIFILVMFLLSTGLVSVMYLVDKPVSSSDNESGDVVTGDVAGSGLNLSGSNITGSVFTGK